MHQQWVAQMFEATGRSAQQLRPTNLFADKNAQIFRQVPEYEANPFYLNTIDLTCAPIQIQLDRLEMLLQK